MSFLDRIRECHVFDRAAYLPFRVDGLEVGLVGHAFAAALASADHVFKVSGDVVTLAPGLPADPHARTAAIDQALRPLAGQGLLPGWRDEAYIVAAAPGGPELFTMERAAVPKFGIIAAGVHVNGFVRAPDGLKMWIGRRALNKPNSPGKLDQLVAGGQPAGASVFDTVIKESAEEADIPAALAGAAVPVGAITYRTEQPEGLRRDILYNYDLELAGDFVPHNTDGELSDFYLWPIDRVIDTVRDSDEFKFNCALVVIDFLIRHGYIGPDEPDYLAIVHGLRGLFRPGEPLIRGATP